MQKMQTDQKCDVAKRDSLSTAQCSGRHRKYDGGLPKMSTCSSVLLDEHQAKQDSWKGARGKTRSPGGASRFTHRHGVTFQSLGERTTGVASPQNAR